MIQSIVFGIIAGMITGLGMGGGTILILLLSNFLDFEQHVAQATNLIYFIPTSLVTIIINMKNKNINFKLAKWISIFGVIGALIGAKLTEIVDSKNLKKYFAIFIMIIGFIEFYKIIKEYIFVKKRNNKDKIKKVN